MSSQVPRHQFNDDDVAVLAQDERLLAVTMFQITRYPNNIVDTDELLELWLDRKLQATDFDGRVFLPSRRGLTRPAFTDAWQRLSQKIRAGEITPLPDILDRYVDIRDYEPKAKLGEQ